MNEKVKQALEKLRELDLYDLHSKDFDNILGALNNMEELIKGKDEYIAKLCCDRAELKEHEKELIAEQHRLFDLAKEQEKELKELKEFARIVVEKSVDIDILKSYIKCDKLNGEDFDYRKYKTYNYAIFSKQKLIQAEFDLVKEVVENYGTK